MNTLYIPCLSNYFMKFLLIKKKKKLSVVKKETFSPHEGKDCALSCLCLCACVCFYIPTDGLGCFQTK